MLERLADGPLRRGVQQVDAHGVHSPKLKPMRRCVRIEYVGQFHLDIVPAALVASPTPTNILITDSTTQSCGRLRSLTVLHPRSPEVNAERPSVARRLLAFVQRFGNLGAPCKLELPGAVRWVPRLLLK